MFPPRKKLLTAWGTIFWKYTGHLMEAGILHCMEEITENSMEARSGILKR